MFGPAAGDGAAMPEIDSGIGAGIGVACGPGADGGNVERGSGGACPATGGEVAGARRGAAGAGGVAGGTGNSGGFGRDGSDAGAASPASCSARS